MKPFPILLSLLTSATVTMVQSQSVRAMSSAQVAQIAQNITVM